MLVGLWSASAAVVSGCDTVILVVSVGEGEITRGFGGCGDMEEALCLREPMLRSTEERTGSPTVTISCVTGLPEIENKEH